MSAKQLERLVEFSLGASCPLVLFEKKNDDAPLMCQSMTIDVQIDLSTAVISIHGIWDQPSPDKPQDETKKVCINSYTLIKYIL